MIQCHHNWQIRANVCYLCSSTCVHTFLNAVWCLANVSLQINCQSTHPNDARSVIRLSHLCTRLRVCVHAAPIARFCVSMLVDLRTKAIHNANDVRINARESIDGFSLVYKRKPSLLTNIVRDRINPLDASST